MLGLPLDSFILLFVLPTLVLIPMFYYCWQIKKGRD
jgi:hypothetical protein